MAPQIVKPKSIIQPKVARAPALNYPGSEGGDTSEEQELPLGIRMTGGAKLRKEGKTGKNVKVAVIDSGVDAEHEGFNGMVVSQMWFREGTPLERDDHGTHVAGTIHMMAPEAELYDYRVFGEEGWEIDDAISTAIVEAVFDGCDVINMSLGGRFWSASIRTAVDFAFNKGVYIVCAAGNEGDDDPLTHERSFPAMWDESISIAALSKTDGLPRAYFSNTNPSVDYAGVGVDVVSFKPGGGYQEMSGTSMAAPHVAGLIAALLTNTEKDVDVTTVKNARKRDKKFRSLLETYLCIDVDVEGPDLSTGAGFLTYLSEDELNELLPSYTSS